MPRIHAFIVAVAGLALAAVLSTDSYAQAAIAVPGPQKHACKKPDEHPGKLASDNQVRNWTRTANAYLECVKKFISEQQAAAKPYQDAIKAHIDAANGAITEYNDAVKSFKEQQDQAAKD